MAWQAGQDDIYYFVNIRAFCYFVIMYMFFERVHIYPDVCLWRSEEILFYSTNAMRDNTNRRQALLDTVQQLQLFNEMHHLIYNYVYFLGKTRPGNLPKSKQQANHPTHTFLATGNLASILASHKEKGLRDFFDSKMNSLREFYNVKINAQGSPYLGGTGGIPPTKSKKILRS